MNKSIKAFITSEYGALVILIPLCAYFSWETISVQHPVSPSAGRKMAARILDEVGNEASVLIVTQDNVADRPFAESVRLELSAGGVENVLMFAGAPSDLKARFREISLGDQPITAIATHHKCAEWKLLEQPSQENANLEGVRVFEPASYLWPSFLTRENILNVLNQNALIAIIAIGMTMVIVTAGIDLSVGSLLALSGVLTAFIIQRVLGAEQASLYALQLAGILGIATCAVCGAFSGVMVAWCRVPAFIVTLSMMMMARGAAYKMTMNYHDGTPQAIMIDARNFDWLAQGTFSGVPNSIIVMFFLFIVAHVVMSRTAFGRYVYAVGGNEEAARLSGVPIKRTIILVYTICGALAGLVGVINASRFNGGDPKEGELYELSVIAAVVVGGTSIAGGEGKVLGTLIGAMILAVMRNGLNMTGWDTFYQQIIFGGLILAAVLLDKFKTQYWRA